MQTEFGGRLKETETLKAELQELQLLNKKLNQQLDASESQLKEYKQLCDQKDGQKEKDLAEISGLQRTLAELECKNKRLADLLSSQLCS
jgi:chromosome segregation ATPase